MITDSKMELTGKCKIEFEKWFNEQVKDSVYDVKVLSLFGGLYDSMKHGVFVDFFDSVGVNISVECVFDRMLGYTRGYQIQVYQEGNQPITVFKDGDCFDNRKETQTKAIEKANEIYNDNNN